MWDNYVGKQIERCRTNVRNSAFGWLAGSVVAGLLAYALRSGSSSTWAIVALIGAIVMLVIGFSNLSTWLLWRNKPDRHQAVVELAQYGDVAKLADQISREVAEAGDEVIRVGSSKLTESWLLEEDSLGFHATPYARIAWVFEKSTKHYTNFIPTGTTHELIVRTAVGTERTISGIGDKDVKFLMLQIKAQNPSIVLGYNEQLDGLWKSDPAGTARSLAARRTPGQESGEP